MGQLGLEEIERRTIVNLLDLGNDFIFLERDFILDGQ